MEMETCFDETLILQTPPAKAVLMMPYSFLAALAEDLSGKMLMLKTTTLLTVAQATFQPQMSRLLETPHGKEVGLWTSLAQAVQWQMIQLEVMMDEHVRPLPMRVAVVVLQRIQELILVEGLVQSILLMEAVSDFLLL